MTAYSTGPRHQARKRFGQHFLHDRNVIARIVDAIGPKPGEALVEIGPGLGALTRPVLERARSLETIELDRDVIPHLTAACADAGTLVVHSGDILEMDIRALAAGRRVTHGCAAGHVRLRTTDRDAGSILRVDSVVRCRPRRLQTATEG